MSRAGRVLAAAAAAGAAMLLARSAIAQEGPIVIGQRQKSDFFKLDTIHGDVELEYRYESDEIKPRLGTQTKFEENRLEEKLGLWTNGYIVHPNLVELHLAGTFGLVQDELKNTAEGIDTKENPDTTQYEWDVSATILRKQEAPITLYSRRTVQTITREFGPSIDSTLTQSGAILDWRSRTTPTRIEAYHMDQEQTSIGSTEDFSLAQDTITWHSEWRPSTKQVLTWDYTFNAINETNVNGATDSFNTHDATLTHSWDFGPKEKYNLSSSLNYFNQDGNFAIEHLRWNELLRLKHSDSFETRYQYILDQQSTDQQGFGSSDQTQQRAEAGFVHRLYKSLVTTGVAGAEKIDRSDSGDSFEKYARLDSEYTKTVPLGRLILSAGLGYDQMENDARSGVTQVLDAQSQFNDPLPIVLTGQNIMARSVRITDPTGLIIYLPGRDYQVKGFADHLQIDRIVGGRIANAQPILIDYDLAPQASNTVDTFNFHFGGRYQIEQGPFKGLAFYGRYNHQDQTIDSDVPSQFTPNEFTDVVIGSDYKRGDFTLGAEREWSDSTIQPLDATRFWGQYSHRFGRDTLLTLSSSYSSIDFTDTGDHVDLLLGNATVTQQISRDLRLVANLVYRDDNDDFLGKTRGVEEQLELHWDRRQLHFYIQARNSTLNTDGVDTSFQMLLVGIRREF